MRRISAVLAIAATVVLVGCTPVLSVNPLYTDDGAVTEPALTGIWGDDDGGDVWVVRTHGSDAYSVVIAPSKETAPVQIYDARLVRLWGRLYADCTARSNADIPGHVLVAVTLEGDRLQVALPDGDWLQKNAEQFTLPAHSTTGNALVITAPTADVQAFMVRCAAAPGCFGDPGKFHRLK